VNPRAREIERLLAVLDRLADAVERFSVDFATVHNLRLTECPECHQRANEEGQIFHVSGCMALWPANLQNRHIPGEGL